MEQDTIAAIATPMGRGGIGIVKLSGKNAFNILAAVFQRSAPGASTGDTPPILPAASPRMLYGHIRDPVTGNVVDEVLVSLMPGPRSYTREDVVEINTHAGQVVTNAVLSLVLARGARLADPGEFTKRAFLNGRIDLTQAEAVLDIIEAKTDRALALAAQQAQGTLGKAVRGVLAVLRDVRAEIEANIDFPDDVPEASDGNRLADRLDRLVLHPLESLLRQYDTQHLIKAGIRVLILGKPNVGKSSLMNCLLKKDRVIVAASPGTTRDFIEAECRVAGMPVVYIDTAGVHGAADPIEQIGIQKTVEHIETADVVLFVMDVSIPLDANDMQIFGRVRHKNTILVLNKIDLTGDAPGDRLPADWAGTPLVETSARYGNGIDALEKAIIHCAMGGNGDAAVTGAVALNLRHKQDIENCARCVERAATGIRDGLYPELTAVELKDAGAHLEAVLGINTPLDILDNIFERFCIGK